MAATSQHSSEYDSYQEVRGGWVLTFGDVGVGVAAVLGHAVAGEVLGFVGVEVDGVVVEDVEELLEGFHDEDESDEKREALLRETSDVLHLRPTTTPVR